jgi:dTDP-4-dehydrorhamnose reductase
VPTSSRSLAAALWTLARSGESGLFHYCDSGSTSRHGLAVSIQDQARSLGLLDKAIPIVPLRSDEVGAPARRPAYSVLDSSDCWRILGGRPPEWADNLRLTLEEIRDHG